MSKARAPMLCAALLLAACAPANAPEPVASAAGPTAQPAADASPAATADPVPRSESRSEYASIEAGQCALESRDPESGGTRHLCAGVAGYRLRVHDDDARMSLDVIAPDGDVHPLDFQRVAGPGFSELGDRVEWRFAPGSDAPLALIVRFGEYVEPDRPTQWLLVARIDGAGSCVISKIPPSPAQNEQARAMAYVAAERPCMEPPAA